MIIRGTFEDRTESVSINSQQLVYRIPAVVTYQFLGKELENRPGVLSRWTPIEGRPLDLIWSVSQEYVLQLSESAGTVLVNECGQWILKGHGQSVSIGPLLDDYDRDIVLMAISRWLCKQSAGQIYDEVCYAYARKRSA